MSSFVLLIFISVLSLFAFIETSVFGLSKLKRLSTFEDRALNLEKAVLAERLLGIETRATFRRFEGSSLKDAYLLTELFGREAVCPSKTESEISKEASIISRHTCNLTLISDNSFFSENVSATKLTSRFLASKGSIKLKEANQSLIIAGGDIKIEKALGTLYLYSGTGKITVHESNYQIFAKGRRGIPPRALEPPNLLSKSKLILGLITPP
jgi:hypothetical protein